MKDTPNSPSAISRNALGPQTHLLQGFGILGMHAKSSVFYLHKQLLQRQRGKQKNNIFGGASGGHWIYIYIYIYIWDDVPRK